MLGRTFCPLGDAAAMPTISIVEKFRNEFEDHLNGRPRSVRARHAYGDGMSVAKDHGSAASTLVSRPLAHARMCGIGGGAKSVPMSRDAANTSASATGLQNG